MKVAVTMTTISTLFSCRCDECGHGYMRFDQMQDCKNTHAGIFKFNCPHCEYKTNKSKALANHITTHRWFIYFFLVIFSHINPVQQRCKAMDMSHLPAHEQHYEQPEQSHQEGAQGDTLPGGNDDQEESIWQRYDRGWSWTESGCSSGNITLVSEFLHVDKCAFLSIKERGHDS